MSPRKKGQEGQARQADETGQASQAGRARQADETAQASQALKAGEAGAEAVEAVDEATPAASAADAQALVDLLGDDEPARTVSAEVKAVVEALIFASPDPITPKALCKLMAEEPKEDVLAAIAELKKDYERPGGLQFVEVAGGYQIVTRADLHDWVRKLFHERSTQKLTIQGLETLAVIAYKQPITALEITEVRGVSAAGVLSTLLDRHFIKIVGRKQVVGRPFMYATTKEFLIRFGLNDLSDLPKVEDMAAALGFDSPLLTEKLPSEEVLPLDEPDPDAGFIPPPGESSGSVH